MIRAWHLPSSKPACEQFGKDTPARIVFASFWASLNRSIQENSDGSGLARLRLKEFPHEDRILWLQLGLIILERRRHLLSRSAQRAFDARSRYNLLRARRL